MVSDAGQPKLHSLSSPAGWIDSSELAYGLLEPDPGPLGLHFTEESSAVQSLLYCGLEKIHFESYQLPCKLAEADFQSALTIKLLS